MPELPEVETIRRQLLQNVFGKEIKEVKVLVPKLVKGMSPVLFGRKITGKKITGIRRRGKYLIFDLDGLPGKRPSLYLQVHLKLTGQLLYSAGPTPKIDYHLFFRFNDDSRLYYHDLRRFGGFTLLDQDPAALLNLGPEPLTPDFTFARWKQILDKKTTRVKTLLLDQQKIAGLGNIYASEALFRAGIHPDRIVSSLQSNEQKKLYEAINAVLTEALKAGGTSIQDYLKPDGSDGNFQKSLFVYRRKGQKCLRCRHAIEVKKDGSRSTYFCPHCQT